MIHEVDEVLRSLLSNHVLPDVITDIDLATPNRDWAARRTGPTLNLFLYDVREEVSRRERGPIAIRDERGVVLHRRQPPRWFRLSYLVTAWTTQPQDEHRLLSAVLSLLLRHEVLPAETLPGPLAELGLEIPLSVAVPPSESRSLADIWTALGGELKASLDIVVIAPIPAYPEYQVGPPVTRDITIDVRAPDDQPRETAKRIFEDAPRPS